MPAPNSLSPHNHAGPHHMHHQMGPGGPNSGPPPNAYMGGPNQSPHPMMSTNGYNNGMNGGMGMNHPMMGNPNQRNGPQNQPTPPPQVPVSASGNAPTTTGRRGRKRANML